ncbi:MAG TPA: patatin-like phospholipase family protein [Thermoanaerobaculia bacterium]|nr:patatin-like phospholipase family protein [Thermoanaerobaculia bacterium]
MAPVIPAQAGDRHALVLSGGGARGAYEVGVMKALFEGAIPVMGGRRPEIRIFTGTSVGALNATFLAQQPWPGLESVEILEEIWRERIANTPASCGNGVYRLRADPTRIFDPGCLSNPFERLVELGRDAAFWSGYALTYGTQLVRSEAPLRVRVLESFDLTALFSRSPLESLLADTIDLGRLRASGNGLAVVTSDWRNGVPKVLDKADVTERLGTDAILASAAIPGIFPPVDLDGTPCVDGALLMNTPLLPAIEMGASVIHVIYLDPLVAEIPFPELPNTLDTFYRFYDIVLAANVRNDLGTAEGINEELELLASLGIIDEDGTFLAADLPPRLRRASRVAERIAEGRPYRPLVVHRYRPKNDLGGVEGFLDFTDDFISDLIEQGYRDALQHDCEDAQCALPPAVPLRSEPGVRTA